MKVALVHPLKHHAYHSLYGIHLSGNEARGYFGYYNNKGIIDRALESTPYGKKALGFKYNKIDKLVDSSLINKINFIKYKMNPKDNWDSYIKSFQIRSMKYIEEYDAIHVFQDYCNDVIRRAKDSGKVIVYEQIQPFDIVQKRILEEEIIKYDYKKEYSSKRFSQEKIEKQIENLSMVDVIISASDVTTESLNGYVADNNIIHQFPYGAKINNYSLEDIKKSLRLKQKNKKLKILYVGSINLIKGVQYIIQAAKQLEDEEIEFTFIGKPNFEEDIILVKKIRELKNSVYIESVPNIEIYKKYIENDIFIFQGLCEGFGMVTLEAMSYGLPCIVSMGGKGIITDRKDGLINSNNDVNGIINSILYFYENKDNIGIMAEEAFKSVRKYDWSRFEKNISGVYNKLL